MVEWGEAIEGSAKELLAETDGNEDDKNDAKAAAEQFLRELLTGPTPTNTVRSEAKEGGHAWATVRRASESLRVIKKKGTDGWYWQLVSAKVLPFKVLTKKHEEVEQVEHVAEGCLDAEGAQDAQEIKVSNLEQVADAEEF